MRKHISLLTLGALLLSTGAFAASAPAATGNAKNGKALFHSSGCYECHGTVAQGSPRTGPTLQNPLPFSVFLSRLRTPVSEMPPYTERVISDAQAADIHAFILSLPPPPDWKSIKLLQ